jgi:transcription antitermination factor NusG
MKKFLAIYIGTPSALGKSEWNTMDEAKRKKLEASGIKAWGDWMMANKAAIVDQGGPLGKTKRTATQGVSDTKNNMTGYVTVQAESHDAAARMFENHPHFTIFPGDSVEIMECLPIPGQALR